MTVKGPKGSEGRMPTLRRWFRPTSMGGKLFLSLGALYLLAALASGWASYDNYGRTVRLFMDDQMRALAASYANRTAAGELNHPSDESLYKWGGFIVQVWTADSRLAASSRSDIAVPMQAGAGFHTVTTAGRDGGVDSWRVYTGRPDARSGAAMIVQIAQSEYFLDHEVAKRALYAAVPIALLMPFSLLILWIIKIGRAHV